MQPHHDELEEYGEDAPLLEDGDAGDGLPSRDAIAGTGDGDPKLGGRHGTVGQAELAQKVGTQLEPTEGEERYDFALLSSELKGLARNLIRLRGQAQDLEDTVNIALRHDHEDLKIDDLGDDYILALLCIIRIVNALHTAFYLSTLTHGVFKGLCASMGVRNMRLKLELDRSEIYLHAGALVWYSNIAWDYDTEGMAQLTKLASSLMNGDVSIHAAHRTLDSIAAGEERGKVEAFFRDFPGRLLILPVLSSTAAVVFFNGFHLEGAWALVTGTTAGLLLWAGDSFPSLSKTTDLSVSISSGFIAQASSVTSANACFQSVVLGTLYWFFYGTAFTLGFFELLEGSNTIGVVRLMNALLKTITLAFGAAVGVYLGAWAVPASVKTLELGESARCVSQTDIKVWYNLFIFPISALACLGQFRVNIHHVPACLITQSVAYWVQLVVQSVWNKPSFLANLLASTASVLVAQLLLEIYKMLRWQPIFEGFHGGSSFSNESTEPSSQDKLGKARRALKESRSGNWAILVTAVYILVPGSSIFRNAFAEVILSMIAEDSNKFLYAILNAADLTSSFVTVGLSICLGIKIGFLILTACEELVRLCSSRHLRPNLLERTNTHRSLY